MSRCLTKAEEKTVSLEYLVFALSSIRDLLVKSRGRGYIRCWWRSSMSVGCKSSSFRRQSEENRRTTMSVLIRYTDRHVYTVLGVLLCHFNSGLVKTFSLDIQTAWVCIQSCEFYRCDLCGARFSIRTTFTIMKQLQFLKHWSEQVFIHFSSKAAQADAPVTLLLILLMNQTWFYVIPSLQVK